MSDGNNLELYLNDIFKKECEFTIDEDDVNFIQYGIEDLVQRIVNAVLEELRKKEMLMVTTLHNSDIIKVGSFYEGTKNKFPDEFDIIFCFYEEQERAVFPSFPVTNVIKDVCHRNRRALEYRSSENSKQKIKFKKYIEQHGPATWLRFNYTNKTGEQKCINVDLVPAGRIHITGREHMLAVSEICQVGPFVSEILSTGSFLLVGDDYSFTETEANFMKNILSLKHKKVYRILKQLINGHSNGDVFKDGSMSCYTSYVIKSVMIIHHYRCKRMGNIQLGPCLLEIADELLTYEYDTELPRLVALKLSVVSALPESFSELFLKNQLQALTSNLRSMQNLTEGYAYDDFKGRKSLLEQYLDENNGKAGMEFNFNICSVL